MPPMKMCSKAGLPQAACSLAPAATAFIQFCSMRPAQWVLGLQAIVASLWPWNRAEVQS